jgi:hypothetical protein
MRAWFALTTGDYRGVIAAARAGAETAAHHGVAVQLAAQEAETWARLGDRRQVEVALDKGRRLLEAMPYPENLDNHFVVDPAKFGFYAMDCYRLVGEDKLARTLAEEVLRAGTDFDGTERRLCGTLKLASRWASQPHGRATWNRHSSWATGPSKGTVGRCHRSS